MGNDTSDTNDVKISPGARQSGPVRAALPRGRPQPLNPDASDASSPAERSRALTWARSLSQARERPVADGATGPRRPAADGAGVESGP